MIRRRTRVFIGCEGDSERSYARWMQDRLDESGLSIHLDTYIAGGGDPLAVVENSVRECARRESLYGKYKKRGIFLDADKIGEKVERDSKIEPIAAKAKVELIYQDIDHEAVLLRHFPHCQTKRPPRHLSTAALKKVWPHYMKPADARALSSVLSMYTFRQSLTVEHMLRTFLESLGFS